MREIIADYIRHGSHSCFTAEDSAEALMVLKIDPVDLMILDIMLPHLDGFSVCKAANMRGLVSTLAVLVRAPQKT